MQKMPPEKVYRISVDVGADGKKKKIKYSNEYDYDVTLRTIVDSEYMTVRQDHVVIPEGAAVPVVQVRGECSFGARRDSMMAQLGPHG